MNDNQKLAQQERLDKQFAFALEIDKEKRIGRQTYCSDGDTLENDAEHAWHAALMAVLFSESANEPVDVLKVVKMLLIHDIVEIDAGDTYAYDTKALETQKEREEKAADRIFGILPEDQRDELRALFEEFEAGKSPEARFAKVMDNFQPLLLNNSNGGADWREHKATKSKVVGRQQTSSLGSEEIWKYTEKLINENVEKGNIIDN